MLGKPESQQAQGLPSVMSFRFHKSELALGCPRLWNWKRRLKFLHDGALASALLLALLACCDCLRRAG